MVALVGSRNAEGDFLPPSVSVADVSDFWVHDAEASRHSFSFAYAFTPGCRVDFQPEAKRCIERQVPIRKTRESERVR